MENQIRIEAHYVQINNEENSYLKNNDLLVEKQIN